ncbi:12318_t:CDS:2 [Dentiscutata erythropus]|uniref:12318_t:CDS:1 n=1 Tax=Dentiscutata erythropus TaxID=1348616 RepID=A0A9N9BWW4_9GLOM|nr:12318_t:CDS:2 [Dentiscutata erythropus]
MSSLSKLNLHCGRFTFIETQPSDVDIRPARHYACVTITRANSDAKPVPVKMMSTEKSKTYLQESLFHYEFDAQSDSLSKLWKNFPPVRWLIYTILVFQSIPSMILALTVLLSCMIISAIGSFCIVITSIILCFPPLIIVISITIFNKVLLGVGNVSKNFEDLLDGVFLERRD